MRKLPIFPIIVLLAAIAAGSHGCRKSMTGINNNQVIEAPFSLFFSDTAGALYSSNDGKTVRKTLFHADGYPGKAICVSANNLLWGKKDLLISTNNGVNFNHTFDSFGRYPGVGCTGLPVDLNQSMMLDIPSWNRVYTVATEDWTGDYLGLRYSLSKGMPVTWYTEGEPDKEGNFGGYGVTGIDSSLMVTITSLTQLKSTVLCGYDAWHNRNFYKTTAEARWKETTSNTSDSIYHPLIGTGRPHYNGLRLPHHDTFLTPSDMTARYSYGHYNDRLIAIDNYNCSSNGAYYSDDTGRNWVHYIGLPAKPLLCILAPFDEVCLVGTGGAGLYVLNTNTGVWQQSNHGLATDLIIRNIAFKQNFYKDADIKKYIFLATNKGIYMSSDLGENWTMTIAGNYVTIY
jgi:hypothetical protein